MPAQSFRRCHHCDQCLEREQGPIVLCDGCGKHLAPFYFFKDTDVASYTDNALRPTSDVAIMRGFAVAWGVDEEGQARR
jgi:hypothetical protein